MNIPYAISMRKYALLAVALIVPVLAFLFLLSSSLTSAQSDQSPQSVQAALGPGITYQGFLNLNGSPADGTFSFKFALFDAKSGGSQLGTTETKNVPVSNGVFTTILNAGGQFGTDAFNGEARFLEISVSNDGGSSYTTLTPRQALTGTPYAHSLRPGAKIDSTVNNGSILILENDGSNGFGLSAKSTNSALFVQETGGDGLFVCNTGSAIGCNPNDSLHNGVEVSKAEHYGLWVTETVNGDGVFVDKASDDGFQVANAGDDGIDINAADDGVRVRTVGGDGLEVEEANTGVRIVKALDAGVNIESAAGSGVFVQSAQTGFGAIEASGNGFYAGKVDTGVFVDGPVTNWAGYFTGSVNVTGTCTGCLLATFGVNTSDSVLQLGDVVTVQGIRSGEGLEQSMLMEVEQAGAGASVVGVVYGSGELVTIDNPDGEQITQLVPREGAAEAGDFVHIVTHGPVQVKASAFNNAIQVGDRLSMDASGVARGLQTRELDGMIITEGAPTIGTALENLEASQDGLIWVLVNPR